MKKIYTLLSLLFVSVALSVGLTSCDDDYYGPPGSTYDPYLIGTWELWQADGVPVYGYQVNWLEFYRNGSGTYYYYHNGKQYSMGLSYDVDWYGGGSELYIYYADGTSASMNYWFNSNRSYLYTQWYEYGYRHTYVYRYVDGPAWAPKKSSFSPVEPVRGQTPALPALTPGITQPEQER